MVFQNAPVLVDEQNLTQWCWWNLNFLTLMGARLLCSLIRLFIFQLQFFISQVCENYLPLRPSTKASPESVVHYDLRYGCSFTLRTAENNTSQDFNLFSGICCHKAYRHCLLAIKTVHFAWVRSWWENPSGMTFAYTNTNIRLISS